MHRQRRRSSRPWSAYWCAEAKGIKIMAENNGISEKKHDVKLFRMICGRYGVKFSNDYSAAMFMNDDGTIQPLTEDIIRNKVFRNIAKETADNLD
jgi:hypothetical protein